MATHRRKGSYGFEYHWHCSLNSELGACGSLLDFLATMQANKADRTLNEIKDKIMSWQDRMNAAAISLIEARPEVIAQKVSLEEARNNAEFVDRIADIIERLATEADENTTGFKVAIIKELLSNQKALIVDREKIKADVISGRERSEEPK